MITFPRFLGLSLVFSFFVATGVQAADTAEILFTGQTSETVNLATAGPVTTVTARVQLDFSDVPEGLLAHELFKVSIEGERIVIDLVSSGKLLITQGSPEVRSDREGNDLKLIARYGFSFHDLSPLNRVLETNLTKSLVKDGKLFFEAAPDLFDMDLALRLTLGKKRIFLPHRILYDRPLTGASFSRNPTEDGKMLYWTELKDIGVPELTRGVFEFTISGGPVFSGETILNPAQLVHDGKMQTSVSARGKTKLLTK